MGTAQVDLDQQADQRRCISAGVVDQDDILIVKRAQGGGPLVLNMSMGSRLPILTSSAGWRAPCRPARRSARQADSKAQVGVISISVRKVGFAARVNPHSLKPSGTNENNS